MNPMWNILSFLVIVYNINQVHFHSSAIVKDVPLGGVCHNSSDCTTDRAICFYNRCACPDQYIELFPAIPNVCVKKIYHLKDPCDFHMQCALLVDKNSVCDSVCVCSFSYVKWNDRCIFKRPMSTARPALTQVKIGEICRSSSNCITGRAVCSRGICECPRNHYVHSTDNGYGICREIEIKGDDDISEYNSSKKTLIVYICVIFFIVVISCSAIMKSSFWSQDTSGQNRATQIDDADRWTSLVDRALQNSRTQSHNADQWTSQFDSANHNRTTQIDSANHNMRSQIDNTNHNRTTQIHSPDQSRRIQIDNANQNQTTQIYSADSLSVNTINDNPPSYDEVAVSEDVTDLPSYSDALELSMTEKCPL